MAGAVRDMELETSSSEDERFEQPLAAPAAIPWAARRRAAVRTASLGAAAMAVLALAGTAAAGTMLLPGSPAAAAPRAARREAFVGLESALALGDCWGGFPEGTKVEDEGADCGSRKDVDLDGCKQYCGGKEGCKSFAFTRSWGGQCYCKTKQITGGSATVPDNHGFTTYYKKPCGDSGNDEGDKDEPDKPALKNCLCVFDVDRTLTGKQGWEDQCDKATELNGVQDQAYAKGTLMVSELAQSVGSSFCGECYHGIVTAGQASGPYSAERQRLLEYLGGTAHTRSDYWQDVQFKPWTKVVSSLVVQASDGKKQESVKSMVQWWREKQGLDLKDEDVYFFDDIKENVEPFRGTGLNARQVSCGSRGPAEFPGQYDGKVGGCGGALDELKRIKGVHVCDDEE